MTDSTWPAALSFVWRPENDGQRLHTDANDSGGATNMGITHATWASAAEQGIVPDGITLGDATDAQLGAVLHIMFWKAAACDRLAAGADLAVFNLAMVGGTGRAARVLQSAVGTVQDGAVGPLTLAAAATFGAVPLIGMFTAKEEAFYASIPSAKFFLKGWDRRADDCRTLALQLTALASPT